jgi:hypothetical protein
MSITRSLPSLIGAFSIAGGLLLAASAVAGPPSPLDVRVKRVGEQTAMLDRSEDAGGGIAGGCDPVVVSHSASDFQAGEYIAQGGMIEGEIAATSHVLPAEAFPVRIDLIEVLFATSAASVETTTVYGIHVWSGLPSSGALVFSVVSDGDILPNLIMPPGTNGTKVQFLVDPGDPDQIWVDDDGSHTVTIGIEIVQHNQPPANQCLSAPSPTVCRVRPATGSTSRTAASSDARQAGSGSPTCLRRAVRAVTGCSDSHGPRACATTSARAASAAPVRRSTR